MSSNLIVPPRLKPGDMLRIIAPSRSGQILSNEIIEKASNNLREAGFRVSFGRHWKDSHDFYSRESIEARVEDLHEAFNDSSVQGIMSAIGGYNSNQLLPLMDFELIRKNPKVFCGYSDITVLLNAILARSGLVTFLGPHFSTWAMDEGSQYSRDMFLAATCTSDDISVSPSPQWSNDNWYKDQRNRIFHENNDGMVVLQHGEANGTLYGGNLASFTNLNGTKFSPKLKQSILLIEQAEEYTGLNVFDAQLESLLLQNNQNKISGILIGRFPYESITLEEVRQLILSKNIPKNIPIVANVNFGHTNPIATFPLGNKCDITTFSELRVVIHGR